MVVVCVVCLKLYVVVVVFLGGWGGGEGVGI